MTTLSRLHRSAALTATLIALPVALVAGLTVFGLSGGFDGGATPAPSGTVSIAPVPSPVPTDAVAACRALIAALPDDVDGHRRRPVTGDPERVAAWGDPPIVLRCASGPLVTPTGDTQTLGIQNVWWVTDGSGTVWTSFRRSVTVELRIPAQYEEPGQRIVNPLSEVIAATVPARR